MTQPAASPSMSFGTAITTVARKYADFEGRATRSEFWWFILFAALVSGALGALNIVTPQGTLALGSALASVWAVATIVPTLAVGVRRLRDTDRSWKQIFWILVPIAGVIVLVIAWVEPSKPGAVAA
ncbi:MAG: DUF805 domain-containing protein [Rhodoglobus sp.]